MKPKKNKPKGFVAPQKKKVDAEKKDDSPKATTTEAPVAAAGSEQVEKDNNSVEKDNNPAKNVEVPAEVKTSGTKTETSEQPQECETLEAVDTKTEPNEARETENDIPDNKSDNFSASDNDDGTSLMFPCSFSVLWFTYCWFIFISC